MTSGFKSIQLQIRRVLRNTAKVILRAVQCCTKGWRLTASSYVVAIVTVGLGTLFRLGMDPLLGNHQPFTIYFAAVAITAWYGGFAPALFATILAYLAADWFFIPPRFEFHRPHNANYDEFVGLMAFLFSSLAIAFTSKVMRQALEKARQRQRELQHEIVERERAEKDLQQAQAQLRRYATLLEERVEERTAHLQETIHSLEGVCYHIAHDLRAPLRAIEGYIKILLSQYAPTFDAAGEEYANRVSEAAARMDLLIHGLLEYGRLGHEDFPLESMESAAALQRVLGLFKNEIARKDAKVTVEGEWSSVVGNEKLLEIVLASLLSNALKFVASGVLPRVKMRAETRGDVVRFSVEDNGIGIAPEYLHKAFRIFERLHPGNSYAGTGIGLAIATKAAERMDGRLGLESKINHGSQFWIELPRAENDAAAQVSMRANPDLLAIH